MDCRLPGSSLCGILQGRTLVWVGIPYSRGSPQPRDGSRSPALKADSLPFESSGKPNNPGVGSLSLLQLIFLTQELHWGFLHCRWILYQLSYQGSYDEMTNCGIHEWVLCHVLHFQLLLPTSRCYQAEFGPIGIFQCIVACNFLIFCGGFLHIYL